jgi:hypothetical protein
MLYIYLDNKKAKKFILFFLNVVFIIRLNSLLTVEMFAVLTRTWPFGRPYAAQAFGTCANASTRLPASAWACTCVGQLGNETPLQNR